MSDFSYYTERKNYGVRILLAVTVLAVFLFVLDLATGGMIRAAVQRSVADVYLPTSGTFTTFTYFRTRSSMQNEIDMLHKELNDLRENFATDAIIQDENSSLRTLVNLAKEEPGITAAVVSSERASPYGTFLIGAGSIEGIGNGDLVEIGSGVVIGVVTSVHAHSSLVTTLFAPNASIDAMLDGTAILVEGYGGGNAEAKVPHGVVVQGR
jgi:cell shape-determining protein MreC